MSTSETKQNKQAPDHQKKNKRVLLGVIGVVAAMVVLSFASVPLYNLFCRVTGFGGTTQVAGTDTPVEVIDREITVKFNADISSDLPWEFKPEQREVSLNIGEQVKVAYSARSLVNKPTGGTAMYNVTPQKAGKYFQKIECFCFQEQILEPGERVSMPIVFYVDPAIAEDRNLDDVTTITLSYSFFQSNSEALDQALEDFYNQTPATENQAKADMTALTE